TGLEARDMALTPPTLARLIQLVKEGQLNRNTAVKVCEAVFETDGDVDAYVAAHGLAQVSDAGLVAQVVEQVLSANEKSVADYRSGKEKAFGFLVGQVMRQLRGQAAPAVVRQVLLEQLAEQ
ncbi:Asp-tRNA(Asn)/Glu-tRNA(Gln) amidotransferase GatCAB subunit B, partial [Flavonifractor plautii]